MQRALMQYRNPANYALVKEALVKAGRTDLIGFTPQCLIRPYPPKAPRRDAEKSEMQPAASQKPSRKGTAQPPRTAAPKKPRGRR